MISFKFYIFLHYIYIQKQPLNKHTVIYTNNIFINLIYFESSKSVLYYSIIKYKNINFNPGKINLEFYVVYKNFISIIDSHYNNSLNAKRKKNYLNPKIYI